VPDLVELFGPERWGKLGLLVHVAETCTRDGRAGKAGRRTRLPLVEAGPPPGLLAYDDAQA